MKKLTLMTMVAFAALLFTSCGKADYSQLVGTWGTEKIEYYNIDYWGNPIPGSGDTYVFDYDDPDKVQVNIKVNSIEQIPFSSLKTKASVQDVVQHEAQIYNLHGGDDRHDDVVVFVGGEPIQYAYRQYDGAQRVEYPPVYFPELGQHDKDEVGAEYEYVDACK